MIQEVREQIIADYNTSLSAQQCDKRAEEAENYANTICTFLSLTLGRCAEFSSSLCHWSPSGEKIMSVFGHQALPMAWDFGEANLLIDTVGSWLTRCDYVADCIKVIGQISTKVGKVHHNDASTGTKESGIVISTDPPYYDNIGYAALSDFFYVWHRRTLGDIYPDLFKTILVPKTQELTAEAWRFGGDKLQAREHFESGFQKTFENLRKKMDNCFPLSIYYAFKQGDNDTDYSVDKNEVIETVVDKTSGWETLLNALLSAGFQITATLPIRAAQQWRMRAVDSNALASYIVLTCRVRPENAPSNNRRSFLQELKRELPAALKHLQQGNIAPVDLAQAAVGAGMAVFSKYHTVLESNGSAMPVRTALGFINQTIDDVLNEQENEYDKETRFLVAWYEQHGHEVGEYGDAETLSRAKNTAVAALNEAGLIIAKGGKVHIVHRDKLPEKFDYRKLTVWEVCQRLLHYLDKHGETGAADLMQKLNGETCEIARDLAYRLHKTCEKNGWTNEAVMYNSLVLSWSEISKLANENRPKQGQFI